jgi:hypothetical protein
MNDDEKRQIMADLAAFMGTTEEEVRATFLRAVRQSAKERESLEKIRDRESAEHSEEPK